jgi:uncharacterized protein YbjT (DUF2867 family)
MQMIVVTGGTGLIGGEVLRRLSQAGVPARAMTRDLKKARTMPGVTWIAGNLGRPETLRTAFDGAKTLFLLRTISKTWWSCSTTPLPLRATPGVAHVVKVSEFGATAHSRAPIGRWHY